MSGWISLKTTATARQAIGHRAGRPQVVNLAAHRGQRDPAAGSDRWLYRSPGSSAWLALAGVPLLLGRCGPPQPLRGVPIPQQTKPIPRSPNGLSSSLGLSRHCGPPRASEPARGSGRQRSGQPAHRDDAVAGHADTGPAVVQHRQPTGFDRTAGHHRGVGLITGTPTVPEAIALIVVMVRPLSRSPRKPG